MDKKSRNQDSQSRVSLQNFEKWSQSTKDKSEFQDPIYWSMPTLDLPYGAIGIE